MLLGFYAGNSCWTNSDQSFLVELKPETAKSCAETFRKMQEFCGKDFFSLEVKEFRMRDFPLDNVWELDTDVKLPEEFDFVEVPAGTLEPKTSDFFSGSCVLDEMGLYWYLANRREWHYPDIRTPVLTLEQLDEIAEGRGLRPWEEFIP